MLSRLSNPTDTLAPPPSPYPQNVDPSPVDSNGTESTEIDEEAQEDAGLKPAAETTYGDVQSPDVEITSPESASSVRQSRQCSNVHALTWTGAHATTEYADPPTTTFR